MLKSAYSIILGIANKLINSFPINGKLKKIIAGQATIWNELSQITFQSPIWFHIASAGEYEQAKPIIEELSKNTNHQIIITFFSPSGYEAQKNNDLVDGVFYLPFDTVSNVQRFLDIVKPSCCILVKYEFWLNYMTELNRREIPILLVSALLHKNHFLFKWYGKAHLKQVKQFNYIATQNQETQELLAQYNIGSVVTGDTRIDRSLELPKTEFESKILNEFSKTGINIILASVWQKDFDIWDTHINTIIKRGGKLIIAPHELEPKFLEQLQTKWNAKLLSQLTEENLNDVKAIIIDKMGVLKYIYRYGDIAYVGGGFGKGIHNTLEPASYRLPIVFGPNYKKFVEAVEMVKQQASFPVHNENELLKTIAFLFVDENREKAGQHAKQYLLNNQGATKLVVAKIMSLLDSNKSDE